MGIKPTSEALKLAKTEGLDLIEISPTAKPPVTRIMDRGKYQYQLNKEAQKSKKKTREIGIKGIRVRLGTNIHDLILKAKQAEKFMNEGNRVQIQLTLKGREKYLDKTFIETRLKKILEAITVPHKISDGPKKAPRGLLVIIEPAQYGKNKQSSSKKIKGDGNGKNPEASSAPKPLQRESEEDKTARPQGMEKISDGQEH